MYHTDYFGLGSVPQNPEQFVQSPSRDDWSQWGQGSNGLNMSQLVDNCTENSEVSLHGTELLGDWPDYQFHERSEMNWEDEVFMSSFPKDDQPSIKVPYRSIGMYPDTECSSRPFDNLLTDMIVDSQSISTDQSDLGSSKYTEHDFPPSMDWNKWDETSHFMFSSNTEQMKVTAETKAPVLKILIPDELKTSLRADGHVDEETSFKATALQDLEEVMTQLTPKTRIFFRDALYRLANSSSKQQRLRSQNQSGDLTLNEPTLSTFDRETTTFRKTKLMELETNIIDRTIAELMFNELNCNAPDVSSMGSVDFSDKSVTATSSFNSSFNHSALLPRPYAE
ncbi:hypothetical protein BVC80_1467g6 [Macleaya cordata]|uniref:Protein LNK3 n=1 Tax=Macleaya cordata TaxID=56857 RepID=A0A200PUW0_MACCD|nr:hypothetical protein BVC80_1467g6 [Macleaya cordata]